MNNGKTVLENSIIFDWKSLFSKSQFTPLLIRYSRVISNLCTYPAWYNPSNHTIRLIKRRLWLTASDHQGGWQEIIKIVNEGPPRQLVIKGIEFLGGEGPNIIFITLFLTLYHDVSFLFYQINCLMNIKHGVTKRVSSKYLY